MLIAQNMTTENNLGLREKEPTKRLSLSRFLRGYVPKLPKKDLKAIAGEFKPVKFNKGDRIVGQGEPGDAMYLITRGRAQVLFTPLGGAFGTPSEEVAILEKGALLGEMALVFNQPRSATAVALEPVEAFSLSRDSGIYLQALFPAFWSQVKVVAENRQRENQQPT